MPKYLVERDFGQISDDDMQEFAAVAGDIRAEQFPEIEWEGTHVCDDDNGGVTAFCVYTAPSALVLREHAERLPGNVRHSIYEISESSAFAP